MIVSLFLAILVIRIYSMTFNGTRKELEEFFDSNLIDKGMMEDFGVAGLGVTVVHKGKVIFFKGYGYEDHEKGTPVTENTMFGLASISKTFCAVASVNEFSAEEVQANVNTFSPHNHKLSPYVRGNYISANGRPRERSDESVTLNNLYTHSAGFDETIFYFNRDLTLSEDVEKHMPHRIREPSIVSTYSNYGVAYLALLLENRKNMKYSEILESSIFSPLKLNSTSYGWENAKKNEHICQPYYTSGKGDSRSFKPFPVDIQDITSRPAASIYSSSGDLSNYAIALLKGDARIFSKDDSYKELFTKRFELSKTFPSFMNTIFYTIPTGDIRWDIHDGDLPPYHGSLMLQRDSDVAVILLMSSSASSFRGTLRDRFTYKFYKSCSAHGGVEDAESETCERTYDLPTTWPDPKSKKNTYKNMVGCYMSWRYSHTGWTKLVMMVTYYSLGPSLYFCLEVGEDGYLKVTGEPKVLFLENVFSNTSDTASDFVIGKLGEHGSVKVALSNAGTVPNMYFLNEGDDRRYWVSGLVFNTYEYLGGEWTGSWLIFQQVFLTLVHILNQVFLGLCCCVFCVPVWCLCCCKCYKWIKAKRGKDREGKGYSKMEADEEDGAPVEDVEMIDSAGNSETPLDQASSDWNEGGQGLAEGEGMDEDEDELEKNYIATSSGEDENVYILELQQQMGTKGKKKVRNSFCVIFCYICFLALVFIFAGLSTLMNTFHYLLVYVIVTTVYFVTYDIDPAFLSFAVSLPIFSIIFIFCCIITLGLMYAFFIGVACLTSTVNWKKIRWYVWLQMFLVPVVAVVVIFGNVSYFVTISEYNTFVYK